MDLAVLAKSLNTAMLLVLAFGLWKRHTPRVHIPAMLIAFVVDLGNVVVVELAARRSKGVGAVEQATQAVLQGGSTLSQVHIAASALTIAGYFVAAITGTLLYRRGRARRVHKANAAAFIVMRLLSYVTSFWM
jgi:hypothetical protein